jgi:hypothetical protein
MKEIIITKKIDTKELAGSITLKALSYPERIAISKKSVTTVVQGEAGSETVINDNLDRSLEYYELACKQITKVDVTIKQEDEGATDTAIKLTCVDDLMVYEQGTAIVMDIAAELIAGVNLGNEK